jgi:hypothetical protein
MVELWKWHCLDNYLHLTTKGKQDGQDTIADCDVSNSSLSGVTLVMFP